MKFLKWYVTKTIKEASIWGWIYFVACGFIGASISNGNKNLLLVAIALLGVILVRWTIVEALKRAYQEYVKERNELFTQIKNSDK